LAHALEATIHDRLDMDDLAAAVATAHALAG
jgi:hypothetical protein